jgi:hypothetical protein
MKRLTIIPRQPSFSLIWQEMFFRANMFLEFYLDASDREEAELICYSNSTITAVIIEEDIFRVEYIHERDVHIDVPILHVKPADPFDIQPLIIRVPS